MRSSYLTLSVLWLSGTAATAQAPPPLPDLRPGHVIRVEAGTVAGRLEGRFERYTADSLIMTPDSSLSTAVPISGVTALWVRGRATRTGAIVGGVIGGAGGAIILSVLCGISAADDGIIGNEGFDPACPAIGAGVGMLVGGGAGAGIGALIPTWRLRFRMPR